MSLRRATPADAAAIARVHVDAWRTTYAGIVPAEHLARLSYIEREATWRKNLGAREDATFTFVIETESAEVVAFATGGPERSGDRIYRGELHAIYILQPHQRQGHGGRLIGAVARQLLAQGYETLLVWVLAQNASRNFYESLGGKLVRSTMVEIGGTPLEEMAYGWNDLHRLAELV